MKLPGTVPPNVQNVYVTPSEIGISFSMTSSSTITFAGAVRPVAGGTRGGLVRTALTGSPCGGPKSPGEAAAGATVAADAPNILLAGVFPVRSHPDRATALPSSSARAMRCIRSSLDEWDIRICTFPRCAPSTSIALTCVKSTCDSSPEEREPAQRVVGKRDADDRRVNEDRGREAQRAAARRLRSPEGCTPEADVECDEHDLDSQPLVREQRTRQRY